jgi:hypothetical protein
MLFVLSSFIYAGIFELYGTGDYNADYSAASAGRGSVSLAYTDSLTSSYRNPALLAHIQFTGLEAGIRSKFSYISDFGYNESIMLFDYINLMIPLGKKGGMQFGLNPLTSARAEYQIKTHYITEIIKNTGDIYSISLGMGYRFHENIYAGLTWEMLFGGYVQSNQITFSNPDFYSSERYFSKGVDGRRFTLGFLALYNNLNIGLTYSHPYTMKYKSFEYDSYNSYVYNEPLDTTLTHDIILPREMSAGLAFKIGRRHYLMTDYTYRYLKNTEGLRLFNPLRPDFNSSGSHHLGVGYERRGAVGLFIPFFESLTYRTGAFYDQNHLSVEMSRYGISAGLGIPFNNFKSRIDLSLNYGLNSGIVFENIDIDESFFQVKISVNSIERWFNTRGKYR